MNKLNIQWFIEQHKDWEKLLSEKPYCLQITRDTWNGLRLIMFKYSQIDSDFNEIICRECRGLILNEDTLEVVSYPFQKFGNVQEGTWVEKIDWTKHPYVLEKCDGSLIKVVRIGDNLLISTNGTILASSAPIAEQIACPAATFEELFYYALKSQFKDFTHEWFLNLFSEGYTYMFELCTIFNKVVIPHKDPKTYFIGVRNNKTFQETFIYEHPLSKIFPTPKMYEFDTFEHCIETAKNLPWDNEGYVITSRDFKRNKAKSLGYLSCHHLKNNGVMSYDRAVELVRLNEVDEVVAYFPEFQEKLMEIKAKYNDFISSIHESYDKLEDWIKSNGYASRMWLVGSGGKNRKDLAKFAFQTFKIPGIVFSIVDGKVSSVDEWIKNCPTNKITEYLGY